MRRNRTLSVAAVVVLLAAAMIFFTARRAAAAPSGSRWGAGYFPNVALTTQDGKTVHFYDDLLKGKIVAIDLIYTHCKDECPLETAKMSQVQHLLGDRVGKDIFFYSISIDPTQDTPAVMKAYAEKFHAGPGWLFLTGKKEDIDLIAKKIGLYSPNWGRDGHKANLMLGNEATGQWVLTSAIDNPRFIASEVHTFLDSWKNAGARQRQNYSEAPKLTITKGQYLFRTRCSACHTVGHGEGVGPDLGGAAERHERAWLMRFIQKPDEMLAEKDPVATALFKKYKQIQMPNLRVSEEDAAELIEYIRSETASASANVSATQKPAAMGMPSPMKR